jgi:hypothetical protein
MDGSERRYIMVLYLKQLLPNALALTGLVDIEI